MPEGAPGADEGKSHQQSHLPVNLESQNNDLPGKTVHDNSGIVLQRLPTALSLDFRANPQRELVIPDIKSLRTHGLSDHRPSYNYLSEEI